MRSGDNFAQNPSPKAYSELVNQLLESKHFGERMAIYWLDLVRYADTVGYHGDQPHNISPYRDWVINAFNENMPFDQFTREQLAGDLLKSPRINTSEKLNESALGTGHFRMIEHGYQPVDTVDEQVRNVDNQIDVVSKTFLGLTVSCARCHDHKFDAISQADFTAFYGIRMARALNKTYLEPLTSTFPKERLGSTGDVAKVGCATCHAPERDFTDGKKVAVGVGVTPRNAPTSIGAARNSWFFWDGRKDSQWSQALASIENPLEHDMPRDRVVVTAWCYCS